MSREESTIDKIDEEIKDIFSLKEYRDDKDYYHFLVMQRISQIRRLVAKYKEAEA